MTGNAVGGTAYLSVDGTTLALVGEFEYDSGLVEREPATGMDTVHGTIQKPKHSMIKGTVRNMPGISVGALNAMENVTVVCELNNGKVVTGRNMWTNGKETAEAAEGKIAVEWNGLQGAVVEDEGSTA